LFSFLPVFSEPPDFEPSVQTSPRIEIQRDFHEGVVGVAYSAWRTEIRRIQTKCFAALPPPRIKPGTPRIQPSTCAKMHSGGDRSGFRNAPSCRRDRREKARRR